MEPDLPRQLGADPDDPRIRQAAEHVLTWCPTSSGGSGCSGSSKEKNPPPSATLHCLNGNLVRALVVFGYLDDPRVQARSTGRQERSPEKPSIDGTHLRRVNLGSPACQRPTPLCVGRRQRVVRSDLCSPRRRTAKVRRAIEVGVEFLLSRDPAVADYPMGYGNTKPNGSWFRLGFPSAYVADVLQVLAVVAELKRASDPRLEQATDWLLANKSSPADGSTDTARTGRQQSISNARANRRNGLRCVPRRSSKPPTGRRRAGDSPGWSLRQPLPRGSSRPSAPLP